MTFSVDGRLAVLECGPLKVVSQLSRLIMGHITSHGETSSRPPKALFEKYDRKTTLY